MPTSVETERFVGRILGVDVIFALVCINCKSRIRDSDEQFVECTSCKTTILKDFVKKTVFANVLLIDENAENKGRFRCSEEVLNGMFKSIKQTENYSLDQTDATKLPRKMIIESLLLVKKVLFDVAKNENVVVKMSVSEQ